MVDRTYVKLTVNSVEYTDAYDITSSGVSGDNNSSSSFTAYFPNTTGEHSSSFVIGHDVRIYSDKNVNPPTTLVFSGIVDDIVFSGRPNSEFITLTGRNYIALLMDTTVSPVTYSNQEVSTIVTSLISSNITGITTTNVQVTTTTVNYIAFNHVSIFDAIKQLADLVDYYFEVDVNLDLHFKPKGVVSSGESLNNTNVLSANFTKSDQDLYNNVWVYGDRQLTKWQNNFTANGGSVYSLSYQPHNTEVIIGGSTVSKFGGVFNLTTTTQSGINYLVDFNGKRIIFTSGTAIGNSIPVSGTDAIKINYQRSTPIIKFAHDSTSELAYKKRTKVIIDKNIKNPAMAKDVANNFLAQHKDPLIQGNLKIDGIVNLTPSQTVNINLPYHGINNQVYNIVQVDYNFTKSNLLSNQVLSIIVNRRIDDITDTLKQMILDIKKLQSGEINTYDVISRLESATGSVGVKVKSWSVSTQSIGSDFYLGSPASENGWIGSPGSYWLGSHATSWAVVYSGGD